MDTLRLTSQRRRQLRRLVRMTKEARVVRRALALLELDEGRPVTQVAAVLGVTRQTLYNWVERFTAEGSPIDLHDRDGRGRPAALSEAQRKFLAWSLTQPPAMLGYTSVEWTVPLLREHLAIHMAGHVSERTLRRELHRLGYAWKRPRYVLQPDPEREKKKPTSEPDPRAPRAHHRAGAR